MWKLRPGVLGGRFSSQGFLHSGRRYAAFNRDRFRRALCLGLSIADGLGQHLAQLDFSLWRFAREGFCPCCHRQHMGMPQGELNPRLSRQGSNVDLDGGFEFTPHSSCLSWVKTGKAQREQMFSAVHPTTDIAKILRQVRFVPVATVAPQQTFLYSITSSARPSNGSGTVRPRLARTTQ